MNEINRSFKDTMLTNPHQYLTESLFTLADANSTQLLSSRQHQSDVFNNDNSAFDDASSIASSTEQHQEQEEQEQEQQQQQDTIDTDPLELPPTTPFIPRQQPAFSTTVASIFGYEPATEIQSMTVNEKQQHLMPDCELVSKFINKER